MRRHATGFTGTMLSVSGVHSTNLTLNPSVAARRSSRPRLVLRPRPNIPLAPTTHRPQQQRQRAMRSSSGELNPRRGRRLTASATADLEAGEPEPKLQPLEGRELLMRVLPCVLVASLGAFSFGYHLGIVNPALDNLARDLGIALNTQLKGLVVSTVLVGATVGSSYSGRIADSVGRRAALVGTAAPLVLGSILCGTAANVWFMLVGRLLAGWGIGAASNLVPMYIAEVSPKQLRGTLGSLNQLMICIGILVAVIAGMPLASDPNHWHNMFLFAAVPGLLQGVFMTVVPESPGWLRRNGKVAEAAAAETALWGAPDVSGGDDKDDKDEKKVSTAELFAPANRRAVTIGTGLFFLQQMSGVNAIVYFSSAMFVAAGVESAVAASVAVCATNVVATILSGQALDRLGRKPLLTGSFIGMGISCLVMSYAMANQGTWALAGPVAVIAVMSYIASFGMGCGPIPGLLSSEIFNPRIRGAGMSLCFTTHWVFNFVIGQAFLPVVEAVGGPAVFIGFAGVCALSVLFVKAQVVETKGKSLDVITKELAAAK